VPGKTLLREALGEFDQNAPIGRILDLSEGHDEPQSFDHVEINFIVAKQLQQSVPGLIGIINAHRESSGRE